MISLLWQLLCGHVLADYVFQPEVMARWKKPGAIVPQEAGRWWWWMMAHSLVNGCFVSSITGSTGLGMAEAVIHGFTDYSKCRGWLSPNMDQLIHIGCKVLWAYMASKGGSYG